MVVTAVREAAGKLRRWGALRNKVLVNVLPTHADLERAVDRPGYDWLRAWARYGVVFVQSPRSWSLTGASQAQMNELLLHELTHCVMYQAAAGAEEWQHKGIPIWFREGMASVTADQGYRRGTLADLEKHLLASDRHDPVADAESLYRFNSEIVYTAAHHAFGFLLERYGDGAVRRVLAVMHGGLRFDAAFEQGLGLSRRGFEQEFRQFVRLQGFRARHE